MRRLLITVLAALSLASLPVVAASAGPAVLTPASAPAPSVLADPDCWHTFHTRPTHTGPAIDPCSGRTWLTPTYSAAANVRWYWSCSVATAGCAITNVQGYLQLCVRNLSNGDRAAADAVSLNVWSTREQLIHSLVGSGFALCSTVYTPWLGVRGCGSTDRPLGVYPQVTPVVSQGRGTVHLAVGTDFKVPIPSVDGITLFASLSTYYLLGRGGHCK